MSKPDITVFIPTYFGEDYLEDLFTMVFRQKIDKSYEVLVYDTSSTLNQIGRASCRERV